MDENVSVKACDVCQRDPEVSPVVGVASSSVGPISLAYCGECANKPAEPEWCFTYLWDDVGDRKRENLASHVSALWTWKDGRYWTWDEWVDSEIASPRPLLVYPEPEQVSSENSK